MGGSLKRPQHEITLMQIVDTIDGPQASEACVLGFEECTDQMPCALHDLHKPLRQRLRDFLQTTTLADTTASLRIKQASHK